MSSHHIPYNNVKSPTISPAPRYLGIDTMVHSHLMWLASAALCDTLSPTLPVGWEQRKTHDEKAPLPHYFFNPQLKTAQWEHPSLTHWRSVLHELLATEKKTTHLEAKDDAPGSPGRHAPPKKAMLWVPVKEDS